MNTEKYKKDFSEDKFWEKIGKFAKKAGKDTIYNALSLYYAMKLGKVNTKQILIIIAALGYFISPIDAIPDVIMPIGLTDDAGVLIATVKMISACNDPEVITTAKKKMTKWFS